MRRSSPSSCSSSSSSCVVIDCEPMTAGDDTRDMHKKPRAKWIRRKRRDDGGDFRNASGGSPTNPSRRSSIYRGVTRHRCTGRFEAHLWDRVSWNNVQNKRGKQVYLGAYDDEEAAARTYDLAALRYWGPDTILNFPMDRYKKELEEMQNVSKEEYLASLRRHSSGFSRGVSKYRGVARHHHNGRWEARIGRVHGNKYLYLGTYDTQEEAAAAYDMAALQHRGPNAVTNFDVSNYVDRLKSIGVHPDLPHPIKEPLSQKSQVITESQEPNLKLAAVPSPQRSIPYLHDNDHISTRLIDSVDQMLQIPWSFCCTDIGHNPLPVLGSGGESLPDPFEDRGFEDNIDLIFEVGDTKGDGDEGEGVGEVILSCGISESSSSPTLSTTTSVSCALPV